MIQQTLLLLLALFITAAYRLFILTNSSLTFFSDDAIYASLARFWIEKDFEHVFHPTWQPLYPFLSAITYLFTSSWEVALRVTSLVAGEIILIPLFFLVKKSLSAKDAVIFILITAFFSPLVYASLFTLSDQLSSTLITLSLVIIFFALDSHKNYLLLIASVFFAFSYLARSEGSLFFMLSIFFVTSFLLWKIIFLKQSLKTILLVPIMIVIFAVTASPYAYAIKNQLGFWTLSAKFSAQIQQGHAFALKENTTWSQEVVSIKSPNYKSAYFQGGFEYVLGRLKVFWRSFLEKAEIWRKQFLKIFPAWSIFLIILGIFYAITGKGLLPHLYVLFIMIAVIPITIFSTAAIDIRYLLWSIPLFFYFFYLGGYYLSKNLLPQYKLVAFLPLFLSLFLPALSLDDILDPKTYSQKFTKKHFRPQFIEAANLIKEESFPYSPRIMARREMLEFYSQGQTIYTPQVSVEKLLEYAKNYQVDYLMAWGGELASDPNLSILVNENSNIPQLAKVYSAATQEGLLIIYSLKPDLK